MGNTNLVPFGLDGSSGEIISVEACDSGRTRYVCPDCKTPLIARKGNVRTWHFAHACQDIDDPRYVPCTAPFFSSLCSAARSYAESAANLSMKLAAYQDILQVRFDDGATLEQEYTVTNSRRVLLEHIHTGVSLYGVSFDLAGEVQGVQFCVYLTHPGRSFPAGSLQVPDDARFGAIEIHFDESFKKRFWHIARETGHLKQQVIEALADPARHASMKWLYHARKAKRSRDLRERLLHQHEAEVGRRKTQRYRCFNCTYEWVGEELPACPNCHVGALYISRLRPELSSG
ncbi:MAG: hypothetical protein EPN72_10275 [Nevskiaceae bacterium]|nr:MAG: hypothetical protein EPN61_01875 [Burkholderiaceae bacterium]TBR72344.1 MAG: hypothetical protein EPN72_10275 [Nevskiaceae bacterium]